MISTLDNITKQNNLVAREPSVWRNSFSANARELAPKSALGEMKWEMTSPFLTFTMMWTRKRLSKTGNKRTVRPNYVGVSRIVTPSFWGAWLCFFAYTGLIGVSISKRLGKDCMYIFFVYVCDFPQLILPIGLQNFLSLSF